MDRYRKEILAPKLKQLLQWIQFHPRAGPSGVKQAFLRLTQETERAFLELIEAPRFALLPKYLVLTFAACTIFDANAALAEGPYVFALAEVPENNKVRFVSLRRELVTAIARVVGPGAIPLLMLEAHPDTNKPAKIIAIRLFEDPHEFVSAFFAEDP